MKNQATSAHARALRPYTGEHFDGRRLRERNGTEYTYSGDSVRIARNGLSVESPIRWAFGSGVQAVTPVIERDGKMIEHRLSWYREGNRLGLSPGHQISPGFELEDSLGIVQTTRNVERCFGCHTTGGDPGVTCQSCHADGAAHRQAPRKGTIRRDPSVALCARCHRAPDTQFASRMPELEDPRSIRFAPVGFLASLCARKSTGFTCVSCHDPHGEPARQTVTAVCQSCHKSKARGSCPRAPGCETCHMPSSSPIPGLRFTDHRIRVTGN